MVPWHWNKFKPGWEDAVIHRIQRPRRRSGKGSHGFYYFPIEERGEDWPNPAFNIPPASILEAWNENPFSRNKRLGGRQAWNEIKTWIDDQRALEQASPFNWTQTLGPPFDTFGPSEYANEVAAAMEVWIIDAFMNEDLPYQVQWQENRKTVNNPAYTWGQALAALDTAAPYVYLGPSNGSWVHELIWSAIESPNPGNPYILNVSRYNLGFTLNANQSPSLISDYVMYFLQTAQDEWIAEGFDQPWSIEVWEASGMGWNDIVNNLLFSIDRDDFLTETAFYNNITTSLPASPSGSEYYFQVKFSFDNADPVNLGTIDFKPTSPPPLLDDRVALLVSGTPKLLAYVDDVDDIGAYV